MIVLCYIHSHISSFLHPQLLAPPASKLKLHGMGTGPAKATTVDPSHTLNYGHLANQDTRKSPNLLMLYSPELKGHLITQGICFAPKDVLFGQLLCCRQIHSTCQTVEMGTINKNILCSMCNCSASTS